MWELAPRHRALLVFAEHRYYGQSKPFGKHTRKHMQWLTTEQVGGGSGCRCCCCHLCICMPGSSAPGQKEHMAAVLQPGQHLRYIRPTLAQANDWTKVYSMQAMADYSTLIWELKEELGDSNMPVIGFGGSYGACAPMLRALCCSCCETVSVCADIARP